MNWFRKNKDRDRDKEVQDLPPKCSHTWQDFPWYILQHYTSTDKTSILEIYEPYVCIHCGERMDKKLFNEKIVGVSLREHTDRKKALESHFKEYIKPQPIVEDMIYDMQLVDRERIDKFKKYKKGLDDNVPLLHVSRP